MNYESKDIIELFCAIFGVLATVAGTMWATIKATKRYFENKKNRIKYILCCKRSVFRSIRQLK